MADTTYTDFVEPAIGATWLNDANRKTYGFTSVAHMITIPGRFDGQTVPLLNYYEGVSGGASDVYWDATSTETADNGMIFQVTGVTTGRWKRTEIDILNNKDFGAKGDGSTSDSVAILAAENENREILFTQGTYLYDSNTNPDLDTKIKLDNSTWKSTLVSDTLKFYEDNLIGLHHNHLQNTGNSSPITNGKIVSPPVSKAIISGKVDVIAHWYVDFGTEYSRTGGGWSGWYDWQWNHVGDPINAYDSSRHPYLGWYRGDDSNVLDWQAYWLREYGITAISVVDGGGIFDSTTWNSSADPYYWTYQLFNNTKNFSGLKYIMWGKYNVSSAAVIAQWQDIISNVILKEDINGNKLYPNTYTVVKNGKQYACVFCFDMESLKTTLGGTTAAVVTFLKNRATELIAGGYAGICAMGRGYSTAFSDAEFVDMEQNGVLFYPAGYEGIFDTATIPGGADTYKDLVEDVPNQIPTNKEIVGIATSMHSNASHPSTWNWQGSTPALFEEALNHCIDGIERNNLPKILTIYNVSEWAEGGPGLQPNRLDGFGYLEAVRNAIVGANNNDVTVRESGTFTPNLLFNGANTGMTYSAQNGRWEIVGNNIIYHVGITLTAVGTSTGNASISGLPTKSILLSGTGAVGTMWANNMTWTGTATPALQASNSIDLWITNAGAVSLMTHANFTNTSTFSITLIAPLT